MLPQSAKKYRNLTNKNLKTFVKYRQAKSLQDYFDQRVIRHAGYYDSDCWQFSTVGDKDGYPQVTGSRACKDHKLTRAHQVSYFLHKGEIPDNMFVCHTCDNPWCVNPDHLFLGSPDDNVQDMMKKDRYVHPSQIKRTKKLTEEQEKEVINLKGILPCTKVGPMYNISYSSVASYWRKNATK